MISTTETSLDKCCALCGDTRSRYQRIRSVARGIKNTYRKALDTTATRGKKLKWKVRRTTAYPEQTPSDTNVEKFDEERYSSSAKSKIETYK